MIDEDPSLPNEPAPPAPDTIPAPPPEPELDDGAFARLERFLSQLRVETLAKTDSVRDELGGKIEELTRIGLETQSGLGLLFELQERIADQTRNVVADAIKAGMTELGETFKAGMAELDRRADKRHTDLCGEVKALAGQFEGLKIVVHDHLEVTEEVRDQGYRLSQRVAAEEDESDERKTVADVGE